MSENPGNMRRGSDEFRNRSRGTAMLPDVVQQATRSTRSGRRLATADNAAVAIALSGFTFYWVLPVMRRKRRTKPASSPPTTPPRA
jgi:hypothetical protein